MPKIFLIYYDFKSTSGNHAGMAYLAECLDQNISRLKLLKNPPQEYVFGRYISKIYAVCIALYLAIIIKKEDKIFFFEYLTKDVGYQDLTARILRFLRVDCEFLGLVHLSGEHLMQLYGNVNTIKARLSYLSRVIVFGTSLKSFLESICIKPAVTKTFHYVDTCYYTPGNRHFNSSKIKVVCMGGLKRNFSVLHQIIVNCPSIIFNICIGNNNSLKEYFSGSPNVVLHPFLSEEELLTLMQTSDVSLSVLEDTVGSNVITTSLAVGLIQIVSDVGSIRDYLDDSNSFLCKSIDDYINALHLIDDDFKLRKQMSLGALKSAREISHTEFFAEFKSLIDV